MILRGGIRSDVQKDLYHLQKIMLSIMTSKRLSIAVQIAFNRELTQSRRQRQRKRHLKISIWEMLTIFRLFLLPRILYC